MFVWYFFTPPLYTGTGIWEGDKDAWVNENDGIIQLDFVGHLVSQAIPVSSGHCCHHGHTDQGNTSMLS